MVHRGPSAPGQPESLGGPRVDLGLMSRGDRGPTWETKSALLLFGVRLHGTALGCNRRSHARCGRTASAPNARGSFNGRTADSDSADEGSIPSPRTIENRIVDDDNDAGARDPQRCRSCVGGLRAWLKPRRSRFDSEGRHDGLLAQQQSTGFLHREIRVQIPGSPRGSVALR